MFSRVDLAFMAQRWFADGGDDRFRYTYDLSQDSVVLDIGAYHGKWAKKIFDIYKCNIYAFEPVKEFYSLSSSDPNYHAIKWFNFGIGHKNEDLEIGLSADGSSTFNISGPRERVQIRCMAEIIKILKISFIDLVKINIEGAEYDLMDHIIEQKLQSIMKDIQIQFHITVPDYEKRREIIRNSLLETHFLTYDYPFIWENWRLK